MFDSVWGHRGQELMSVIMNLKGSDLRLIMVIIQITLSKEDDDRRRDSKCLETQLLSFV